MSEKKSGSKSKTVKPGKKTPDSGIYDDGHGGKTTQVEGHTAPPTTKIGSKHKQKVDTCIFRTSVNINSQLDEHDFAMT